MQRLETTKLFYGAYLYKLSIRNQIASSFREKNLPLARRDLDTLQRMYEEGSPLLLITGLRSRTVTKQHFIEASKLYNHFTKNEDYKLRVEQNTMSIYSNNLNWINTIIKEIDLENLISLHEPDTNFVSKLTANTIIVSQSNGYEYKVTLGNIASGETFGKWAINNPNLIKIGPALKDALLNNGYVSGMYFYARDSRTLQLCNLMITNIRRIDKLVVK